MRVDRAWLEAWRWAKYNSGYDRKMAKFRGKEAFTVEEVEELLGWKLTGRYAPKHTREFREGNSPEIVEDTTRRAFAEEDETLALEALCTLKQIGPRTASVLLMAQNPGRYTVMDVKALASLKAVGLLPHVPQQPRQEEWKQAWPEYLAACRHIVEQTGLSLRDIDRGLWGANGDTGYPP